jgi:hypothetical protein
MCLKETYHEARSDKHSLRPRPIHSGLKNGTVFRYCFHLLFIIYHYEDPRKPEGKETELHTAAFGL